MHAYSCVHVDMRTPTGTTSIRNMCRFDKRNILKHQFHLISAGSIFDISKYRNTCESLIPVLSGITILRYFGYRMPTVRYLQYFDTLTSSPFDDVDAKAQHHCR